MKKGENRERRRNKNKKIKKITTNDHNAVYKWVKTEEFLRVTPLTPDFSEVRTFTDATIKVNAQACPLYENALAPPLDRPKVLCKPVS